MPLSLSAPFKTANAWVVAAAVSLLFAISLVAAPIAAADDICDNATLRAQNNSTSLPDCRAYELVTPPYKQGFDVDVIQLGFRDDGVVTYRTVGNFAGNGQGAAFNPYHATRSAAGWMSTALSPPGALYDTQGNPTVESDDLRWSLWPASRRDVPGDRRGFWLRGLDGAFTRIGDGDEESGALVPVGWSDDFSHAVFYNSPQSSDLYEYVGTGNVGSPRAVSVNNLG